MRELCQKEAQKCNDSLYSKVNYQQESFSDKKMSAELGSLKCNRCGFQNLDRIQTYIENMNCPRCGKGIMVNTKD